ncbi:MAG: HAMP domain-containing histidine kinase [Oscillospiraceae bacterium]|nr:HAMP domain-containing histidine kinase [Oscillospiraceae bacterium]
MLKQLRRKFIFITMTLVLLVLTVIFCLVYSSTKADMEAENHNALQRLSQIVTKPMNPEQIPKDIRTPWFALRLSGGIITSVGYTGYDLNDEVFLNTMLQAVYQDGEEEGVLEKYQLMYRRSGDKLTQVIVFLDISGYKASMRSLVESCAVIGAVSLAVLWVICFFLARWAVKPVEQAWDQQRQFVSDASHELKTPLTVIMSNAELLQEEPERSEAAGRYAQNIKAMSHQMKDLVEGMLELSRVDNGQVKKTFQSVNLSELVNQSLLEFEPVMFEQGLTLQSNIAPEVHLAGNDRYLKQAVDILLDNAAKYSDPGVVDVCLFKRGRSCMLTVANPGKPIPEDQREKIFQRFYRADQARIRDGSYGLGLSIAKSIVQEHGGDIWVASNPTGNCFCIQLPCE